MEHYRTEILQTREELNRSGVNVRQKAMRSPAWAGRAPGAMPMGTGSCSRRMTLGSDRQQAKLGPEYVETREVHRSIPS